VEKQNGQGNENGKASMAERPLDKFEIFLYSLNNFYAGGRIPNTSP
jgi:hypothetical protein